LLSKTELLTERTRIALPGPECAALVAAFFNDNREHLRPTFPPVRADFATIENFTKQLTASLERADAGTEFKFWSFDRHNPQIILGSIGLSQIARGAGQYCMLGYSAAKAAEGKGLMFEAIERVIRFAFEDLRLHRIMANHLPENERSARLLKRLGFQVEGLAKDYLFINGQWRDHVLNGLTNPNWRPPAEEESYFTGRL
jgi:ribosomal-protein-alanine N-acetyltransferase